MTIVIPDWALWLALPMCAVSIAQGIVKIRLLRMQLKRTDGGEG